jgi:GntR family transcriptional regulator, transcriptional repressor for pyruvate dehydrogenase complex
MFQKISPRKISDEIIEQFKSLLSRGELKPGDELPSERELADSIGVSRPPLREALNTLQAMGFIEIKPRSRIIVKAVTEKLLRDPLTILIGEDTAKLFEVLEIRRAMESWAAYRAAERATPSDIEKLRKILEKEEDNLKNNREDAKTDADFHVTIALATHNTVFSHLFASWYHLLWNTQQVARDKIFRKKGNRTIIADQHRRLFEAIRDRDRDQASRVATSHIDFVTRELEAFMGLPAGVSKPAQKPGKSQKDQHPGDAEKSPSWASRS